MVMVPTTRSGNSASLGAGGAASIEASTNGGIIACVAPMDTRSPSSSACGNPFRTTARPPAAIAAPKPKTSVLRWNSGRNE